MSDEGEPHRQIVLGINAPGIVEFKASGSKPPIIEIDTGAHFQTTEGNEDRNVLIEWARSVAVKLNFGIIIGKSDFGDNRRKPYFMLVCERSGTYVSTGKKLKTEKTGTRKCQCPFRLRGYLHVTDHKWYMTVVNDTHNHELDKGLEGHLIVGRLKRNEKETMDELTRNLVAPKNILATLKERDPENKTNQRQLYNARYRLKSISLFNSFHTVLAMDSTYKTIKYKMPLFEIVGFTSTQRTFNVGFAWLSNEREENFVWALQQCRSLLRSEDKMPKVILTDRDQALVNAVPQVFPTSASMVCRWHVEKNVSSKMKDLVLVKSGEGVRQSAVWNNITNAFRDLLDSPTEKDYIDNVMEFRKLCARWPRFLQYVEETVLDTDKEKVVRNWVDNFMHMGNYTTNRAESAHGVYKGLLKDGNGDLVKGWEVIDKMLILQFTDVQTQFSQSMSVAEHRYQDNPLYSFLFYKISRAAMDHIYNEAKRVEDVGMDSKKCGCVIRRTFGLPCACLIAKKMKNKLPIRLDEIYSHWKKLCFEEDAVAGEVTDDYACLAEWQAIQERLSRSDVSVKNDIRNQLRLIAFPETTNLQAPVEDAKSKGAKKKKRVRGTTREKSRFEHVDKRVADSQSSQSKPSSSQKKTIKFTSKASGVAKVCGR
ncbi:hypothetical protein P8452_56003 [Trifolium repens]|nr:hypothetical protein P8452_56003 [Trifolium repens]